MKTKKTILYAKALVAALEKAKTKREATSMMRNFLSLVRKQGNTKLLHAMLLEAQRQQRMKAGKEAEMVSALPISAALRKKTLSRLKTKGFGSLVVRTDPRLIGGAALFLGNEYLLDGTLREKLRRIFILGN